jgi:crotonobetainyl-CoA:carnitine CoA-transferase CaiB-like acyl-CoA transferase
MVQSIAGEAVALFPVQVNGHAVPQLRNTAPALGEHTAQVLAELEFSETEIAEFKRAGVVG